ncbi:MAG: hypothetical protein OXI57_02645 [Rhodospirillales bacterium]|nr:hypothetical protein [Rhodospirillales bacterium]
MKLTVLCILTVVLFTAVAVWAQRDDWPRFDPRTFGPQGELREIIVWGFYARDNEGEVRKAEDYLRAMGMLKEGGSVLDVFPDSDLGKERYNRSGQRFCDHVTDEETKGRYPIINADLRVRLYDREGTILSEELLRDEFPENTKRSFPQNTEETAYEWQVIAHVPYHEEGDSLRVVRLAKGKEILLEHLEFHSADKLWREIEEGQFYAYYITDDGCFLSPPLR